MKEELKNALVLGKKCFENGEFPRAELYLQEALRHGDRYADVHNMLGLIYHEQGHFDQAKEEFKRALELNPGYTEASLNLALTCNDVGNYLEGREAFQHAVAWRERKAAGLDPYVKSKLANLYADIGDIYRSLGHYDDATAEYTRALELCPDFVDIWDKLGSTYRDAGKFQNALQTFREALTIGREYIALRLSLGITFFSMGKIEDAMREWQFVVREDPDNEKAKMYLRMVEGTRPQAST